METRHLTDPIDEHDPLERSPAIISIKREVHNLKVESRESAEMFGKIMQTVTNLTNNAATLDATVKTHLSHIDRRFDDLRNDVLRQCVVRHGQVDNRIDKLESHDREIERDVRTMSDDSKVHEIASLRAQLEERQKKQAEAAKAARENKNHWQRYKVTVVVGVVMALLGTGLTLLSSKLNHSSPAPAGAPAASR